MQEGKVLDFTTTDKECHSVFSDLSKALQELDQHRINSLIRRKDILAKKFHSEGETFLHVAAKLGNAETVLQLCQLGADVNAKKRNKETPIFNAVKNSPEVVQILINNGAKVNITCENDISPLQKALIFGTDETVGLIVNKILSEVNESHKEESCIVELMKLVLTQKSQLNLTIMDYPLFFFFAAKVSRDDIFDLVLKDCTNALKSDGDIDYLKKRKEFCPFGEVNFQGHIGRTALHYAVHEQLPQVVNYLVKKGANVNCMSQENLTPFHYALFYDNEPICETLLNYGAQTTPSFWRKSTPHGNSTFRHSLKCDMFHDEKCSINETLTRKFRPRIAKLLLERGFNSNITGHDRKTPLLEACKTGNLEAFKILVQYGANVKAEDKYGNTALHYAALANSFELVDLLIKRGLDINRKNRQQFSPLTLVVFKSNHWRMIQHLVERGADINSQNEEGATALHMASFSNCVGHVECLLELGADKTIKYKSFVMRSWMFDPIPSVSKFYKLYNSQQALISYIALRNESLGDYIKFYVNGAYLQLAFTFFHECKVELEKLKAVKISEVSRLSFHDFLLTNLYNSVKIVGNVDIRKVLKTDSYRLMFPCFLCLLERRVEMAESLKEVVGKTEDFLHNYGKVTKLPNPAVRLILSHFNSLDFRRLGEIFASEKEPSFSSLEI